MNIANPRDFDSKTGECTTMSEALLFEGVRTFALTEEKAAGDTAPETKTTKR